MKMFIAIALVIIAIVSAEPPNGRTILQRQTAAPYQPRGWRPNGPSFNPTLNFQRQQQTPPEPAASYGPPPNASYGPPEAEVTTPEVTTTDSTIEVTTATLDSQGENIKSGFLREQKPEKLQNEPETQSAPVYVVIPQGQNFLYTAALRPLNAALVQPKKDVEVIKEPKLAPVQAIPALAKIQAPVVLAKYAQVPQVVQFQQIQAAPYVRYASSVSQSAVHTPYSESFVHILQ